MAIHTKNTQDIDIYRFRQFIEEMEEKTPKNNHSKTYNDGSNFCPDTWEEALKHARNGIKRQENIQKIVGSMKLLELVKTKTFGMLEHGLCVDVGAYLTGEPECWIAEQWDYKPKKVVKVLVNASASWNWHSKQIENRGAGILALIQMLKKQGYSVKIQIYEGNEYKGKERFLFLSIPNNPLDIQSLCFCLCSASLTRRFMLAWLENKTKRSNCSDDGYGRPMACDEVEMSKDIIHFKGINNEHCNYNSENETKKYIIKTFDKFLALNNETRIEVKG